MQAVCGILMYKIGLYIFAQEIGVLLILSFEGCRGAPIVKYLINTYVRYLSYALLVIAELPNDELTGNHTLNLPPLYL